MSALAASPRGFLHLRPRRLSLLVHRRNLAVVLGLLAAVGAVGAVCLAVGSAGTTPLRALLAVLGQGEPRDVLLVQRLRLPRVEAGLAVGAALGLSGCLMQTLAANRLATPDTVGINNGATAFAVASVVAVPTTLAPPAAALTGAATTAAVTFALSSGPGARGYRFLVVGLGVGAVLGAVTNLVLARASVDAANSAFAWTVGSLSAREAASVRALEAGLVICLPVAALLGRRLALLRFAEPVAVGLGVPVRRTRLAVLAVSVVLAALTVAAAGPLGMVALAAPEAARRLAGPGGVPLVASALAGAAMVLLADLLGRAVLAPLEIPVGLVTAVVGGPYLLWLLLSARTRRSP